VRPETVRFAPAVAVCFGSLKAMSKFSNAPRSARSHDARFGLLAVAAVLAVAVAVVASPAPAQHAKKDGRGELILTNLPPKGTKAYKDLLGLAGKTAKGQDLGFTKSEMWSMPEPLLDHVIRQGEQIGVKITKLGADWNHILKAPAAPMPMSGSQESMLKTMMGAKETMGVGMMASPNSAVVEYALMKEFDAKTAAGQGPRPTLPSRIIIPLNDRDSITVRRTSVDMRKEGCTWRGEIEGTGEPIILIWWQDGRLTGMFTHRGNMYVLKNMGGEVHAVIETDPRKMPPDHGAMRARGAAPQQSADLKDDPLVASGEAATMRTPDRSNIKDRQDLSGSSGVPKAQAPSQAGKRTQVKIEPMPAAKRRAMAAKKIAIDIMVLYTAKVISNYVDFEKDLIALTIEEANESFRNSGLANIKLRLVHSQLIDYDETDGEHFDHLYRMVDGVGPFKAVRKLRDEKRADIVALIIDDASGCGLSTRVAAEADEAFVVAHHSCAAVSHSLTHEIGHIIGARHDRNLDKSMVPFPYGHGYVNGTKWRDIMSYKDSCGGCPRLSFFSSPTVKIKGERGGTVDTDNARVILEQAERVSKFR